MSSSRRFRFYADAVVACVSLATRGRWCHPVSRSYLIGREARALALATAWRGRWRTREAFGVVEVGLWHPLQVVDGFWVVMEAR